MIAVLLFFCAGIALSPAVASAQEATARLEVVDIFFEDEYGEPVERYETKAGGDVVLTFRVTGFGRRAGTDASGLPEDQVRLQYDVELRDPSGAMVKPVDHGEVNTTLGPRDTAWQPRIHWSAPVPAYAPGGDYRIQIRVHDAVAGKEVLQKVSFRVRGVSVRESNSLEIPGLEYGRSEEGPWFSEGYFSWRDPIHVRYQVTGFQISPEKQVWVEQDWAVLDGEGRVVMTRENATVEKSQSFYPPRYLSTFFSLKLDDPQPGAYLLRIDIRDQIGQQVTSYESKFFLRP